MLRGPLLWGRDTGIWLQAQGHQTIATGMQLLGLPGNRSRAMVMQVRDVLFPLLWHHIPQGHTRMYTAT